MALVVLVGCGNAEPQLSTTAEDLVVVSPTTHDFGTVGVGAMSPIFTESVNPSGMNSFDTVTAISESCPDFYIDAPGLPADVYRTCVTSCVGICPAPQAVICGADSEYVSYAFNTYFRPTVPGTQSCVVTVVVSSGNNRTFTLSGTGMAPPVDIDVQPGSIAFGDVRVGTSSSAANISVRNLGGSPLTVSNVSVSGPYALGGPTSFQVPGGGAQNVTVACNPTAPGGVGGNVTISSNDPSTPTTTIPLSCNGVVSSLGIAPSPAVFPTTRVGEPKNLTIVVSNSGGASTTILAVTGGGPGITITSAPPANTVLQPGGSVQVGVKFDAAAPGAASGSIDVATSDGSRSVQLSAMAKVATLSLSPDGNVDFGPVCVGQSASQTFTALGTTDGDFALTAISVPAAPFALTAAPTLPASVRGSGANQVMFSVDVAPTEAGPLTSTMTVATDIPGGAPHDITLTATALTAGVTPTPSELDLGAKPLNETTLGQTITVTNCTAAAVTWTNARIEGADLTDFTIVNQPTSTSIDTASSADWLVVLTPHTGGSKTADFVVDYDGGSARVTLNGQGLTDTPGTPGGTGDIPSYYTCSAGGAGGAGGAVASGPLGLALVLVLRRRRRSAREGQK